MVFTWAPGTCTYCAVVGFVFFDFISDDERVGGSLCGAFGVCICL